MDLNIVVLISLCSLPFCLCMRHGSLLVISVTNQGEFTEMHFDSDPEGYKDVLEK